MEKIACCYCCILVGTFSLHYTTMQRNNTFCACIFNRESSKRLEWKIENGWKVKKNREFVTHKTKRERELLFPSSDPGNPFRRFRAEFLRAQCQLRTIFRITSFLYSTTRGCIKTNSKYNSLTSYTTLVAVDKKLGRFLN